jgi:hypothetical protein
MNAIRIETTIESNGNLHLTDLPFREGDRVEAVLQVVEPVTPNQSKTMSEREKVRAEAIEKFLAMAKASTFRSTAPYPTRDELHERH